MSKLKVYDMQGQALPEVDFAEGLSVGKKGGQAVHDSVVNELAKRRAGTASSLSKGNVSGSGAKPWRQKGTGRARAGYKQSPVWRGGAAAFGPHPRKYGGKVNRKVARLAFQRVLSEKAEAGAIVVINDLSLAEPKTKAFGDLLKTLKIVPPALLLVKDFDRNVALSARNIAGIEMARCAEVGVYQLLRYPVIMITAEGLDALKARIDVDAGGAE